MILSVEKALLWNLRKDCDSSYLDGSLGLDGGNSGVDILGDNITTVQHAAGHVFSVTWVAFDHLVGWLEASVGDLGNGELFMVCLLGGDDWGVGGQWEMDTWVWDQVGLELCKEENDMLGFD